jgi:hypothetical protein
MQTTSATLMTEKLSGAVHGADALAVGSSRRSLGARSSHGYAIVGATLDSRFRTRWVALSGGPGLDLDPGDRGARDAPIACSSRGSLRPQAGARWDHRRPAVVNDVDDLARIDSLGIDRRDPEVRMPELPLNDRQRDPFVRHLDRVGVPELMWREPSAHTGLGREPAKLTPGSCRRPAAAVGWSARMQNSGPIGSCMRCSTQRATCSQPQSSIPTILRLPPLPARTRTDPVFGSRSDSVSISASLIRKPARQRIAVSARTRSAYAPLPASRITRLISSTVGGSAG